MPISIPGFPSGTTRFLGMTVANFSANAGLGQESAGVTVELVPDPDTNDVFTPPNPGEPVSFVVGSGFRFDGIFQYYQTSVSTAGSGIVTVFIEGPTKLLDACQVIVQEYAGNVLGCPNLFNPYGYFENIAFGASQTNSAGMPWSIPVSSLSVSVTGTINFGTNQSIGMYPALNQIINNGAGNGLWGSGVWFANHRYNVDLSGVNNDLNPPTYYRVPGPNSTLGEIISNLYQDAGYDYYSYIVLGSGTTPNIIKFKSINRRTQPSLTQIASYISGQQNVNSKQTGLEFRNGITNAVLVGGPQEQLTLINNNGNNILPYWGTDLGNNLIVGSGTGSNYSFTLDGSSIADVMGIIGNGLGYTTNLTEMRLALVDFDSWAAYVVINNSGVAKPLGIASIVATAESPVAGLIDQFIADDPYTAGVFGSGVTGQLTNLAGKLYSFVSNVAQEYYGRKFVVNLPILSSLTLQPETNNVLTNFTATNAGYLPEGSSPLGLSYQNELAFLDTDGRFRAFSRFDSIGTVDMSTINPDSAVLQDTPAYSENYTNLFVGCSVEDRIVTIPGQGYGVVITYDNPVFNKADSSLGSISDIANILSCTVDDIIDATDFLSETFPIRISPTAYVPDAVAVPLRSNQAVYGPWTSLSSNQGKVEYIKDETLTPWNYGGYSLMNQAATAKLANIVTQFNAVETGSFELPELPQKNLGDQLVANGSEITGISLSYGIDGFKTRYTLATYTPRKQAFTRDKADRLQRIGTALVGIRRALREANLARKNQANIFSAYRSSQLFRLSYGIDQASPQAMVVGHVVQNPITSGYTNYVSNQKFHDAVGNVRANIPSVFQSTAAMSLDGLIRPISTNTGASGIAHLENVTQSTAAITVNSLNPFQSGCDVAWTLYGNSYGGMNSAKRVINYGNARVMAMRGPMLLTGFGYDYFGRPTPNSALGSSGVTYSLGNLPAGSPTGVMTNQLMTDNFYPGYQKLSPLWKTGPVDLAWNDYAKKWTPRGIIHGNVVEPNGINGTGVGMVEVYINGVGVKNYFKAYNRLAASAASGTKVYVGWDDLNGTWDLIAGNCQAG